MLRRYAPPFTLFAGSLLLAACSGGGDGPTDPNPGGQPGQSPLTLAVSFAADTLVLDRWADTATAVVTVRDQNGATPSGVSLSWQAVDPAVATVSPAGVVHSVALGTGKVRVTASRSGSTSVEKELAVRVVAQKNTRCVPATPAARGAASATLSLGPAQILTSLSSPAYAGSRSLAADYDGDGDTDIVRLEYSYPGNQPYTGTLRVFRNTGGTLSDATSAVVQGTIVPDHPRDFEVADFTGDAVPDLYVAQHGYDAAPFPGAPNLFLTRSGAQLADGFSTRFTPAPGNAFSHGSSAGDVDCDGDLDLVELNVSSAYPNQLLLNDGAGRFTPAPAAAFPVGSGTSGQRWQETAFIDFDADGDPDLYLGARSGAGFNEDAFLVNDGFGRFRARDGVRVPSPVFAATHAINNAKAADFNGDGREDLVLFEIPQPFSTTSALRLWLNDGNGSFTDASATWAIPARCDAELIEPLYVRDLNRDGWPDVLLPNGCPNLGGAGVLVNAGDRFQFRAYSTIESWLAQDPATPADIDGDGKLDLFFGERGGNPVLVRGL